MRSYSKPEFSFISLKVEESFAQVAAGSVQCTVTGSCPNEVPFCTFVYDGTTVTANNQ